MAVNTASPVAITDRPGRGRHIALRVIQVVLALFLIIAAAGPKLFGEQTAVDMFAEIGIGQWFRYLVGVIELAAAVGLLVPRLAGLAALGLSLLMLCAAYTQGFVLHGGLLTLTPVVLAAVSAGIAWGRRPGVATPRER